MNRSRRCQLVQGYFGDHRSLSIPELNNLHVVLLEVHLEAEVAVHVGAVTRGVDDPVLDPVGRSRDVLELEQDRVVGVTPRVLGGHLIALWSKLLKVT